MPRHVPLPARVTAAGNPPKLIDEYVGRINTGPSPETFAMDEQRRRIYVSNEEGSSLSIIDMDQNITVFEVPTGAEPEGVFVSEDGGSTWQHKEMPNAFSLRWIRGLSLATGAHGVLVGANGLTIREEIAVCTARLIANPVAHRLKARQIDALLERIDAL